MPPRSTSTGAKKKSVKLDPQHHFSAADASLQEWGSLVQKPKNSDKDGAGGGTGGGGIGSAGNKSTNFVSLLDATALKGMKGKSKGKGKGGLLGAGGAEEQNEKACAICAVTEGSVYPPYPRCEITIAALAAISHYHLTKPKKKEVKKRTASSNSAAKKKAATSSSPPGSPGRAKSPNSPRNNFDDGSNKNNTSGIVEEQLPETLVPDASVSAIPREDIDDEGKTQEEKSAQEEAAARNSTAHVLYCLTCRCLYDDEAAHNWMPHRFCQRCLYCTHGYSDVRVLDLSPGAPTVCKEDGLPVPQTYADVRAQADQGIHWVMPLHESDVLQGRPNLLPPEARDFKSAMNRRRKNENAKDENEASMNPDENNSMALASAAAAAAAALVEPNLPKEFVYEDALTTAVCDIVAANEEFRRGALERSSAHHLFESKKKTTEDFAISFMAMASRTYTSQIFLIQEKLRVETKKLKAAWAERVDAEKADLIVEVDEFYQNLEKERNEAFQEIWMQIIVSRSEMIKKFNNKDGFDLVHSECLKRTAILRDEDDRRYIFWLTTQSIPNFVCDSMQFQKDAVEDCKEKQKEIWKEMNNARVEVGVEKLFDEFGFRQIVAYGTIARLRLQVEAEGDKIYERDVREKASRVDLRYVFMGGRLQAIESEKRRGSYAQRLSFLHMMLTVQEGEERRDVQQYCVKEFSQFLAKLKKQAKSEGLFPDPKQQNLEDIGLALSTSKSVSLFDKKGKLVIPNIPYKKPPAPVPASSNFIEGVFASLTRVFSDPDDVFITADGRVGVKATPDSDDGAILARERVTASFCASENRDKKSNSTGTVSMMMKQSSYQRTMPHGATYFDPDAAPPPELDPARIREQAANAIKKQRGRRRGGGKTANYDADAMAKPLPISMSALEFMGEVGTSIGQLNNSVLAQLLSGNQSFIGSTSGTKGRKKMMAVVNANASFRKLKNSNNNNNHANNLEASTNGNNNLDESKKYNDKSPTNVSGADIGELIVEEDDDEVASIANKRNNQDDESGNYSKRPTSPFNEEEENENALSQTQKRPSSNSPNNNNNAISPPLIDEKSDGASKNSNNNNNNSPAPTSPGLKPLNQNGTKSPQPQNGNSSFRLTSPLNLNNNNNNASFGDKSVILSQTFSQTMMMNGGTSSNLLPHQRLDFVDRSIVSSNALGRPVANMFDDEANHLYFFHSITREEDSNKKGINDCDDLLRSAMERVCVPPPPRHKRERKPAWVEQRANDIFKAAEIPPLPPPPPPPPKPKPKPKGANDQKGNSTRGGGGGVQETGPDGKKRVKFTDEDGEALEFPEGQGSGKGGGGGKAKPKRSAPQADPALLAAMSASQSQREMMRQMSMAAAGENGADMEGAAFGLGHHDEGGDEGSGSAFSLLLAKALDGGKSKGGKGGKKPGGKKKQPGRHYDYM